MPFPQKPSRSITLVQRQSIFALNVARLIQHIFDSGYTCTLGEVMRTKEQAAWYAARGMGVNNSLHCYRLAIDINLFKLGKYLTRTEDYEWLGRYWESLDEDNKWGGNGNDGNHFAMSR